MLTADDIYRLEVAIRAARNDPYSAQPPYVRLKLELAEKIVAALIDVHPDFRTFDDRIDTRRIAQSEQAGAHAPLSSAQTSK